MPVNAAQLLAGANYQLNSYSTSDPVDQFTTARPFAKWLVDHKEDSVFGNGIYNEKVRITNASNYQNFQGSDLVTYNTKDTARLAPFQHYEAHDGFALNETELANNGIVMTDDRESVISDAEKIQIVNKLKEGYATLKDGFQQNWDLEVHQNGAQGALACPGLDYLISTTPTTGVVGGLDPATYTFWRNNVSLAIAATTGVLTQQMEQQWRACMTYGGMAPDYIVCGSKFLDAYRTDALNTVNRQLVISGKGGTNVDSSTTGIYFKGVELVWDPTFDVLDATTPGWAKRCYFLQSKSMKLRPFKGRWMINRKPSRVYDRYTHYFAMTADYGLTINKRNNMAVLQIA